MKWKRDGNQKEIERVLRQLNIPYKDTSKVGGGFSDMVVGYKGINYLLELKVGKNKLQQNQIDFHDIWKGKIDVVRNIDEVLELLGIKIN